MFGNNQSPAKMMNASPVSYTHEEAAKGYREVVQPNGFDDGDGIRAQAMRQGQ